VPPPPKPASDNLGAANIPCTDFAPIEAYLDAPAVREALHVRGALAGTPWIPCGQLDWAFPGNKSAIPAIYQALAGNPLRVLVFSGDVDSCVPFVNTRRKVATLGFPPAGAYRRWFVDDAEGRPQIAGYTQSYGRRASDGAGGSDDGDDVAAAVPALTFATVKGAGHMVASDKPAAALAFFSRFLAGEPL